jgi:hypothetical protein
MHALFLASYRIVPPSRGHSYVHLQHARARVVHESYTCARCTGANVGQRANHDHTEHLIVAQPRWRSRGDANARASTGKCAGRQAPFSRHHMNGRASRMGVKHTSASSATSLSCCSLSATIASSCSAQPRVKGRQVRQRARKWENEHQGGQTTRPPAQRVRRGLSGALT